MRGAETAMATLLCDDYDIICLRRGKKAAKREKHGGVATTASSYACAITHIVLYFRTTYPMRSRKTDGKYYQQFSFLLLQVRK